jgi:hypothetical protein
MPSVVARRPISGRSDNYGEHEPRAEMLRVNGVAFARVLRLRYFAHADEREAIARQHPDHVHQRHRCENASVFGDAKHATVERHDNDEIHVSHQISAVDECDDVSVLLTVHSHLFDYRDSCRARYCSTVPRRASGLVMYRITKSERGEYGNRQRLDRKSVPAFFFRLQNGLATMECK